MSDYSKKVSMAQNLANIVRTVNDIDNDQNGMQLPCVVVSVPNVNQSYVTVQIQVSSNNLPYPIVTVPVAGWKYIQVPIQPGDPGVLITAEVDLTFVSGKYSGNATLVPSGNCESTLMFVPLSNLNNSPAIDPTAVCVHSPGGAILYTDSQTASVTVNPEGVVAQTAEASFSIASGITGGAHALTTPPSTGRVDLWGQFFINGVAYSSGGGGGGTTTTPIFDDIVPGAGFPIAISRINGHAKLAIASQYTLSFIVGLSTSAVAIGFTGTISDDYITLSDWTAATGGATLETNAPYFLGLSGGLVVTPDPSAQIVCCVGTAVSPTTLKFISNLPILL